MSALFGHAAGVGWVALKVLLMFALAVVGFRFGERRTFAQLSPFDFAVSVALGAIIGRTATSDTTSFLTGAVAVLTLLLAHRLITVLRRDDTVANVVDQPPDVLVIHGQLQSPALARSGLTSNDVFALLRQNGIGDLDEVQLMLYETRGGVSLHRVGTPLGPLFRDVLTHAGSDRIDLPASG